MIKALGSLVVAPAELPLPPMPAARMAALQGAEARKALKFAPLALMQAKLGSFIQPLRGRGFTAQTVVDGGGVLAVAGRTASGEAVEVRIRDPRADLLPKWARRVASLMLLSWENDPWDHIIKTMLAEQHLPVDESINWNPILTKLFRRYGFTNDAQREEAIQMALVTALVQRKGLEKFDPERGDAEIKAQPLDKRLTSYILQLFYWQLTGKGEVGDQMHGNLKRELTVLDKPAGGGSLSDFVPTPEASPEAQALEDSDISSYRDFREAFGAYIMKHREPSVAGNVLQVMDLATSGDDGTTIKNEWEATTGTSYSYMRRMLEVMRVELLHFARSSMAPNSRLTQIINDLRSRTQDLDIPEDIEAEKDDAPGGEKAKPMTTSPVAVAGALVAASQKVPVPLERRFMAMLTAAVRQLSRNAKMAAPRVVDHSILYFKMEGDPTEPRYMALRFYSPKLRMNPGSGSYRIEVGDWSTDQSLPQAKIKQQLSTLVVPMMRGDVLDEDHDLLEKVIRHLHSIVWENAIEYFQTPMEEKSTWKNIVKMDLQRLQDARVTVRDEAHGTTEVAASLRESAVGRLAHRMASCEDCEGPQDNCEEPWERVTPHPRWNEEKQTWESTDDGQRGGLLGGQPADYGKKRQISLRASAFPDESKLPKGRIVAEIPLNEGARDKADAEKAQKGVQAADANGQAPESTPAEVSSAMKAGSAAFDPALHDKDAEPSITHMAMHLESTGIDPTSDNMHAAVEGFKSARDAHHTEAS